MIQRKVPASPVLDFLGRDSASEEIRVGVSSCLIGEKVRYDGGDRYHPFINDRLAQCVRLIPVCPEVEAGLGTPREPMDLVLENDGLHLRGVESDRDFPSTLKQIAHAKADELRRLGLCGFVFKSKSPSCGLRSARVKTGANGDGQKGATARAPASNGSSAVRTGRGLFASALLSALPWLPVEEESGLLNAERREAFLERIFALHRLRRLFGSHWNLESLTEFHSNESFLLLAQGGSGPPRLDALLERAGSPEGIPAPSVRLAEDYCRLYLEAMWILDAAAFDPTRESPASVPSSSEGRSRRRQAEVFKRLAACVEGMVSDEELAEIWTAIEDFGRGVIDRTVPLLRIRETAKTHRLPGLAAQSFLAPFPEVLM